MVFSSIPGYVDPHPPNWHHQQPNYHHHHHAQANNGSDVTQLLPPLPPQVGGGSGSTVGSIRPGSMADRARLAKIPPPEAALKCPRCESTNTKFCYFNNYSLSQPRHFCKTCRRYWTRGGALRNVPVGGGCRRNNKKNKRSRSKSPSTTENNNNNNKQILNNGATAATNSELNNIIGQLPQQQQPSNIPFMASLQNLSRYSFGGTDHHHMGFQIGFNSSGGGVEQWRLQQFPFLGSFESNSSGGGNSYPFHQSESIDEEGPSGLVGVGVGDIALGAAPSSSRVTTQMPPPVKMEENGAAAMNLSRSNHPSSSTVSHHDQHQHNNQFYSWTTHDMPGLASNSSTTHHLL